MNFIFNVFRKHVIRLDDGHNRRFFPMGTRRSTRCRITDLGKKRTPNEKAQQYPEKNRIKEQVGIRVIKDLLWNSARKYSPHSFIKLEKLFFWRGVKPPAVNDHGTAQNQNLSIRMDGIGFIIIVEPT